MIGDNDVDQAYSYEGVTPPNLYLALRHLPYVHVTRTYLLQCFNESLMQCRWKLVL